MTIKKKATEIFKDRNELYKRAEEKLQEAKRNLFKGVWKHHRAHMETYTEMLTHAPHGKIRDCKHALKTLALPTAEAVGATVFTGVDARCEAEYNELTTACAGRLIS